MKSLTQSNKNQIYLLLIIIGAFALRIWGIDFGLPHIYHTDEWFEVKRALKLGAGVLDFERVSKGGYFYLLFVEYGIYYAILKIVGLVKSGDDFLFNLFRDPTNMWLIGRVTTAIIGTLNCWFVYLLGKHAFSKTVGLFAALFLAIHLIHVQSSHFITVDVPLTCLITICFLIMFWNSSKPKFTKLHYCLLGFFVAFAIMTKIPAAVIFFPVLLFHYRNLKFESRGVNLKSYFFDARLLCFSLVFLSVYLLGNPGIIIKFKGIMHWALSFFTFWDNVSMGPEFPQLTRHDSLVLYYFNVIFPLRYMILNILIWGGMIFSFKKIHSSKNYLFLSFLIPYCFFLCTSKSVEHIYPRYILPLVPILSIYAAIFLDLLTKKLSKTTSYYAKIITPVLLIVAFFPTIKDTLAFETDRTKPNTQTIAKEWVDENISEDSVIFIEGGLYKVSACTVPLKIKPALVDEIMSEYFAEDENPGNKVKFYEILKKALRYQKTYHLILTSNTRQLLHALNTGTGDYVILRDTTKKAFIADSNRKMFPHLYRLVSWTDSGDFELIKVFEPTDKMRGPRLLVYKRKHDSEP